MTGKEHWMANAELIYWDEEDRWIIGEDDNGDLWVPFVPADMRPCWDRFSRWNPLHWFCYWNSRRRNEMVFLDWDSAANVADDAAWTQHQT
ncbi:MULTISPECIES: hypothetical protein [Mycobacteriaceae]|uniref:hypothetical protein n=1 Tax=Mycobacteriaceae TaxID=1762 RepID=UPI00096F4BE2|nr:hypothetical protein [Mycolicibacterium conceptionense]OMB73170.1 hypothetical protein A5741_05480 [Mycolicibacterium conceptionense]